MSLIEKPITDELSLKSHLPVMRRISPGTAKNPRPPFAMPPVRPPRFAKRVVDITSCGAVADGKKSCTVAIAKAIDLCAAAGGGRVLIPAGHWLTGPIHLRSNVELHLAEGAVVAFSADPQEYLPPVFVRWGGQECFNYSPLIYANDCRNIAITGAGRLLGGGKPWWLWKAAEARSRARLNQMVADGTPVEQRCFGEDEFPLRPQLICAINCEKVLFEDFSIEEGSPFWSLHVVYCQGVLIRRVQIRASEGPNNDGIVIDSSRDVIVEDCDVQAHDDCVALKSGMNEDGWRVGRTTENVIVRRLRCTAGHGGLSIGSEIASPIRNVFAHDCRFDGVAAGIRLKVPRGRGGAVEDVFIQNISMGTIPGDAIQMSTEGGTFVKADGKPLPLKNIQLRNVTCEHAACAVRMIGLQDTPFRQILLENVKITADEGLICTAASALRMVDVRITPRNGPVLSLKDCQQVLIDGLNSVDSRSVFLDLRGRQTQDVRLRGRSEAGARPVVVLGIDVPRDAIVHE